MYTPHYSRIENSVVRNAGTNAAALKDNGFRPSMDKREIKIHVVREVEHLTLVRHIQQAFSVWRCGPTLARPNCSCQELMLAVNSIATETLSKCYGS